MTSQYISGRWSLTYAWTINYNRVNRAESTRRLSTRGCIVPPTVCCPPDTTSQILINQLNKSGDHWFSLVPSLNRSWTDQFCDLPRTKPGDNPLWCKVAGQRAGVDRVDIRRPERGRDTHWQSCARGVQHVLSARRVTRHALGIHLAAQTQTC